MTKKGAIAVIGLVLGLNLFLFTNMSSLPAANPLRIYLDPQGNDRNSGLSADQPLLTLKRAYYIVTAEVAKNPRDVEVMVAPGVYYGQTLSWYTSVPGRYVRIKTNSADPTQWAIFDGRKSAQDKVSETTKFMSIYGTQNVNVERLWIRYYNHGIGLGAGADAPSSHNSISNCVFEKIGDVYWDDRKVADSEELSFSVIGIGNSHYNIIEKNRFFDIKGNASTLHQLYIIGSNNNMILKNRFENAGGVFYPIKLRDSSNNNLIQGNEFQEGRGAVLDWFCNAKDSECKAVVNGDNSKYCTPAQIKAAVQGCAECPSWNNRVLGNLIKGTGMKASAITVLPDSDLSKTNCRKPKPANAFRMLASDNVVNSTQSLVISQVPSTSAAAFCPKSTDCVNASGVCYADRAGEGTFYLCGGNNWYKCTEQTVGQYGFGLRCSNPAADVYRWLKGPRG